MDTPPSTRLEAERLLSTASKLLHSRDFSSSRDFAILAQETDPLLDGSDQIVAVVDVLTASEKPLNNHPDYYSILQLAPRSQDSDLIKKQYRRLALLLHPDKNNFPFADSAFRLVADSWAVLSDPVKKSALDAELGAYYSRVDLQESRRTKEKDLQRMHQTQISKARKQTQNSGGAKLPVRRSTTSAGRKKSVVGDSGVKGLSFWTACPYCYYLFEYPKRYIGCCLICQNCEKTFTADPVVSVPNAVPGKEEYVCCWGMFPMGFSDDNSGKGKSGGKGFHNWVPPMQSGVGAQIPKAVPVTPGNGKKRGRPRKNSL